MDAYLCIQEVPAAKKWKTNNQLKKDQDEFHSINLDRLIESCCCCLRNQTNFQLQYQVLGELSNVENTHCNFEMLYLHPEGHR